MLKVQIQDVGKINYLNVTPPIAGKDQVEVKVETVGICGSDVHVFLGRNPSLKPPKVPGHEFGGRIGTLGSPSGRLRTGMKVVVNPVLNCGHCYYCANSLEHLCEDQAVIGGLVDGAMQERITVPMKNVVALDEAFDMLYAPMIEPTAVAIHCAEKAKNRNILIIGLGTIGLMTQQICKLNNNRILTTDIVDHSLRLSEELNCDYSFNFNNGNRVEEIKSFLGKEKVDCIIDTVCSEETLFFACSMVRKGGEVHIVGIPPKNFIVDVVNILFNEISIRGFSLYSDSEFLLAAEYVSNKTVKTDLLVSKVFPLRNAQEAFEHKHNCKEAVKVILKNE